jgi:heme/copper-type cytochrome/quinol oxidase subunit 2
MQLPRLLLPTLGAAALAIAFAPTAVAQTGTPGLRASVMPSQYLAIAIRPANGAKHDEHVTPLHLAVAPGLPVHITFTNYTGQFHTFTAPGLGVSALIRPAHGNTPTQTTVTFTAHSLGAFDWTCKLCPGQDHQDGAAMRGKIYAIVQV